MTVTAMPPGQDESVEEEPTEGGGRKKKVLILALLVLLALGAAYWFVLRPAPAEAEKPVPGEVMALEPIQLNLAEGHYLRIGIALQGTEKAEEIDGSQALDATISTFSGKPLEELQQPQQREKLRHELAEDLDHLYEGHVMDVYFTEFVTQ